MGTLHLTKKSGILKRSFQAFSIVGCDWPFERFFLVPFSGKRETSRKTGQNTPIMCSVCAPKSVNHSKRRKLADTSLSQPKKWFASSVRCQFDNGACCTRPPKYVRELLPPSHQRPHPLFSLPRPKTHRASSCAQSQGTRQGAETNGS